MDSIRIISKGYGFDTQLFTHEGHEIRGAYNINLSVKADEPVRALINFDMASFDIVVKPEGTDRITRNLLMHKHNEREIKRLGLSRIN